jgi:C4-dicarboxylate-specific signal transduction histidine kinase
MIRYIHSAGEPVFREDGVLVEVIGTVVDITEQKLAADASHKAHAELAQIARATALGELAASIAHEANQPIAAIVSNGDACLSWINRPEPDWIEAQAAVQRMISEGLRASEVIKSVRSLMKRAPLRMLELGINEIIGEVLILVQHEVVSHSISVHTDLADNLPCVTGDRIHLQQVFVNLLMNAIEAMTACGEGPRTILISTQLQSPDQIAVVIRDSGVGIVTENIEQMFEPFFSKKADGMGMGLWISRSIVEAHGGSLWATPNEDSGATFHFTLPANRQTSVFPYGRASDAGV